MARDLLTPEEAGNASASEVVRRWDQALILGALVFVAVFTGSMFALWSIGDPPRMDRVDAVKHGLIALQYLSTQNDQIWWGWGELKYQPWTLARLVLAVLLAAASSAWIGWLAARPVSRVRHIEGPRLLEGKEAVKTCRRISHPDGWLRLHPDLFLRKQHMTRHAIIVGSVGSGKTQILWPLIDQLTKMGRRGRKALIYDVKGDYIAALPQAALVSPWDARSHVWDIAEDLTTPQAAATFAQALIPAKEGEFFGAAAQAIAIGILHQLIHDRQHLGKRWGWRSLADQLVMDPYELKDLLNRHYPAGARLMEDPSSTTALNILQTVAAHTRIIDQLATAWEGSGRKKISFRRWAQDDWKGRRQIILAAGPDTEMTSRYVGAIVNTLIPNIISPALPDNEKGRTLAIVLDEFTSLGKLNIAPLIDKGRSKGCVVILGFQAIDQVKEVYGNNFAAGLMSMVSTHIICQTAMGETQNMLAGLFGRRRVAMTTHSRSASSPGVSVAQHEEQRQVVSPSLLGQELGVKRYGDRWDVRAIVSIGSDPMMLDFPGAPLPKLRRAFVAAEWTEGMPKRAPVPTTDPEQSTPSPQKIGGPKREEKAHEPEVEDRLTALARREGLLP